MKLIKKNRITRARDLFHKIRRDNLFLLSSSISYYSAIAIAPFLLIILSLASFLGEEIKQQIQSFSISISPEAGDLVKIIFSNMKEGINISSFSGFVGLILLFLTSSVVFIQLRYSFDVIYEHHEKRLNRSIWDEILEKLFAVFIVFASSFFLIVASSAPSLLRIFVFQDAPSFFIDYSIHLINFFIFIFMFWAIHYFSPSMRHGKKEAFYMALLTAFFFLIGNHLLGIYLKNIATASIYGAAGSLFVFLIWCYYTTFTLFLSTEILLFLRKFHLNKKGP